MMPARILRKPFLFILAFLLTSFVFTACGDKENDVDEKDTKKTEVKGKDNLLKGKAAYEIEDYHEAALSFALAAQEGNAEAMYLLGKCYREGTGVERNIDKAEKWMKEAADQGHAEAKAFLKRYDGPVEEKTITLAGNVKLELVKVEAGSFEMSARDGENYGDEVAHRATLTKDFYIGQTEVTQAQWKAVMGTNPSYSKGDDLPVEQVSWNDAMEFCGKLNDMGKAPSGWKFTLPTETQWEYAARGGNKSKGYKYSGSNDVGEVAWYDDNSGSKTHPVGQKKSNELGMCDMSGNVWEWCLDDYQNKSDKATAEFARGNDQGSSDRVIRGGSWLNYARRCRSALRDGSGPGDRDDNLGFRLALVPVR